MRRVIVPIFIALMSIGVLTVSGVGIALALENNDAFCAACHTQPETTYVQRATQARASDLASFHTHAATRCIDCHSSAGALGRGQGLQQGARDLANYWRGSYHSPAITLNPLGDPACLQCHPKIYERPASAGKAGTNHYHFYLPQWHQADANAPRCAVCHAPHSTSLESLKFMNQGKVGQECEKCHDALSGVVK